MKIFITVLGDAWIRPKRHTQAGAHPEKGQGKKLRRKGRKERRKEGNKDGSEGRKVGT